MPRVIDRYRDTGPLTSDSIARAALGLIDREGLRALTMRRLGRELGVEAMSIYHHVPGKDAVLAAVLALVVGEQPDAAVHQRSAETGTSSADLLEAASRRLRGALARHPAVLPIMTGDLTRAGLLRPAMTGALEHLVHDGFDDDAARWIVDAFVAFTIGSALVDASAASLSTDAEAAFETGLRLLATGLRIELGI